MANLTIYLILSFLIGIFPSLFWLGFYLRKDPRPEPVRALTIVFLLGAFFTLPAVVLELGWRALFPNAAIVNLFTFALIEELAKFSGASFWVTKTRFFDEKSDPFVYLITSAMGFAMVENTLIFFSEVISKEFLLASLIGSGFLRFLGATFLHLFSSGVLGFFWAYSILQEKKLLLYLGFLISTLLHFLFNFAIISLEKTYFVFILSFLVLGLFVIGLLYKNLRYKNY